MLDDIAGFQAFTIRNLDNKLSTQSDTKQYKVLGVKEDPQYVFYLLWQKETRELSAGVYNLLKCTRSQHMSVSTLLNRVQVCNEHLEANLCTMSVRGTKQYWFIRQSEVRCMIHEWGSPTLI